MALFDLTASLISAFYFGRSLIWPSRRIHGDAAQHGARSKVLFAAARHHHRDGHVLLTAIPHRPLIIIRRTGITASTFGKSFKRRRSRVVPRAPIPSAREQQTHDVAMPVAARDVQGCAARAAHRRPNVRLSNWEAPER